MSDTAINILNKSETYLLETALAWLRQCVFELKQENQTLKDEIAQIKTAVGIE